MPHKHNAARRHHIGKMKVGVTNWAEYEAGLRRRGSLTLWVTPEALDGWAAPRRKTRGGQPLYSDLAIETTLMLGMVFGLRLHQSEEFLNSVLAMMGLDLPVPDHTTLRSCARETAQLRQGVDTLVISGGETDVCVLTAALGAIDLGYGVIILKDAVCSGDARDAALTLFERRFPYRPTL